jgi:hypothetical protein
MAEWKGAFPRPKNLSPSTISKLIKPTEQKIIQGVNCDIVEVALAGWICDVCQCQNRIIREKCAWCGRDRE